MSIHRLFSEHPASVGESYLQHLRVAFGFGAQMVLAGMACLLHAVFPFLCARTGSDCIEQLHQRMMTRRRRSSRVAATEVPVRGTVRSVAH